MTVAIQIQKQIDNISAYREVLTQATIGRTLLWQMAYNTDDEPYVNAVVNQALTNVDNAMNNAAIGSVVTGWFGPQNSYLQTVLGVTVLPGQTSYLDAYIATLGWRVSQYFTRTHKDSLGGYMTTTNVFPRDDLAMGTHAKSGDVFTAGSAVDLTQSGLGRIEAVVPVGTTIGGTTYTVTATLTKLAGTSISLPAAFAGSSPAGTAIIYGEQALSGNAASGQKVVQVAATAQFAANEQVLIYNNAGVSEWGTVASLIANTSITLVNNLINAYTTGASSKVSPLFSAVTAATCTGSGTSGDQVSFKVAPDRIVSLTGSA